MAFRTIRKLDDEYILEGRQHKNRFFTTLPLGVEAETMRYTDKGRLAYDILGFAKTIQEAQIALYRRSF